MKNKMKTSKTLSKRVKITKTGKILRKDVDAGHLKEKWSANKKYRKRGLSKIKNSGHKKIFKMLLPKSNIE